MAEKSSGLESALGQMLGIQAKPAALDPATNSAEAVERRNAEIAHYDKVNLEAATLLGMDTSKATAEELEAAGNMSRAMMAMGLSPQIIKTIMEIANHFGNPNGNNDPNQRVAQNGVITGADFGNLNPPTAQNEELLAQQKAAEANLIPNMA